MKKPKLIATENKGFQLTFDNGWTISVQWGAGNYCSNKMVDTNKNNSMLESANAEIAIWDADHKDFDFGNGQLCLGWLTPNEVADWISVVKKY
jgi:hypothetical protein